MSKNKILLMIVEGPSDEQTLAEPLEEILSPLSVKVKVHHGDFLTKYVLGTNDYEVNSDNVVGKLQAYISNIIIDYKKSYKYKNSDYLHIIYCTDIDNCFKNETPQAKNKRESLQKLFQKDCLVVNKTNIGFNILFFSVNLEHVIHNNINSLTDSEKKDLSIDFIENNRGSFEDVICNLFKGNEIIKWDSIKESYNGVKSLDSDSRATNLNNIISILREIIENNS